MMLYIRMLLSMAVSLYTSRIVLNTLGVEDYGLYTLIAGFVTIFGFLNSTMSGATSRFLTFELGKSDPVRQNKTFCAAMTVHIGIALIVLILAETIGLWFLNCKLNIPADRMFAAQWVYQLSILSILFTIIQVPYNASIIAHERMGVYAYVEILHVTLKLLLVYILLIVSYDKLILYASLSLFVSFIIMNIYRLYCKRSFPECRYSSLGEKGEIRPLLSFSGWDLFGHMSYTVRQQGTNVLLNLFFGAALNAASGLATQVQGIIFSFATNIITAVRPQIIKSFATHKTDQMLNLIFASSKYICFLMIFLIVPLIAEMEFVLTVWLKNVPQYAVQFCQILLLSCIISSISQVVYIGIHATGQLKYSSINRSTIYMLTPVIIWILFRLNFSAITSYVVILLSQIFICGSDIFFLKKSIPSLSVKKMLKEVVAPCLITLTASIIPALLIYGDVSGGWGRLLLVFFETFVIVLIFTAVFTGKETRKIVISRVVKILRRNK